MEKEYKKLKKLFTQREIMLKKSQFLKNIQFEEKKMVWFFRRIR